MRPCRRTSARRSPSSATWSRLRPERRRRVERPRQPAGRCPAISTRRTARTAARSSSTPPACRRASTSGLLRQQRGDLDGAVSRVPRAARDRAAPCLGALPARRRLRGAGRARARARRATPTRSPRSRAPVRREQPAHHREPLVTEALLRARRGSRVGPVDPALLRRGGAHQLHPDARADRAGASRAAAAKRRREREQQTDRATPRAAPLPRDQIVRGAAPRDRSRGSGHDHRRLGQGPRARLERPARQRDATRCAARPTASGAPARAELAAPIGGDGHAAGRTTPPVAQPPAPIRGNAFGIGQRSTGALEWKLGPASDEPVPAR